MHIYMEMNFRFTCIAECGIFLLRLIFVTKSHCHYSVVIKLYRSVVKVFQILYVNINFVAERICK